MNVLLPQIFALLLLTVAPILYLCRFRNRCRPTPRYATLSVAVAVALTLLLVVLTTILHREGSPSRYVLLFFLGTLLVSLFGRRDSRTTAYLTVSFVVALVASWTHIRVATSREYTDNPAARQRARRFAQISTCKENKPLPPDLSLRAEPHTPLTGLYKVVE